MTWLKILQARLFLGLSWQLPDGTRLWPFWGYVRSRDLDKKPVWLRLVHQRVDENGYYDEFLCAAWPLWPFFAIPRWWRYHRWDLERWGAARGYYIGPGDNFYFHEGRWSFRKRSYILGVGWRRESDPITAEDWHRLGR